MSKHGPVILVDKAEKKPYEFKCVRPSLHPPIVKTVHLKTGDYSIETPNATSNAQRITVERKTLADLYATLTSNRERFYRESVRMSEFGYAAIVIEAGMAAILNPNLSLTHPTKASPRSIFGTLFALSERYSIAVWTCPDREFAEQVTYKLLERWHRDHNP